MADPAGDEPKMTTDYRPPGDVSPAAFVSWWHRIRDAPPTGTVPESRNGWPGEKRACNLGATGTRTAHGAYAGGMRGDQLRLASDLLPSGCRPLRHPALVVPWPVSVSPPRSARTSSTTTAGPPIPMSGTVPTSSCYSTPGTRGRRSVRSCFARSARSAGGRPGSRPRAWTPSSAGPVAGDGPGFTSGRRSWSGGC